MSECITSSLLVAQLIQPVVQLEAYLAQELLERKRTTLMIQAQERVHQQSRHDLHHNPIGAVRNQMGQAQGVFEPAEQDFNGPAIKVQQANPFHGQVQQAGDDDNGISLGIQDVDQAIQRLIRVLTLPQSTDTISNQEVAIAQFPIFWQTQFTDRMERNPTVIAADKVIAALDHLIDLMHF